MSNLLARARAVAEQAANEYLASEAERIEQEAEGLRSLVAALVLEHGGPILVSNAALAQAAEVACQMQFIEGEGLVVDVAAEPVREPMTLHVPEFPGGIIERLPPNYESEHRNMDVVEAPSEPAETIPEEPMEQTTDARADRYLARHQGGVVRTGPVAPHKRPWDDPEDLAFQEVAQEQPEKEGGELASGVGEVSVRIGS